MIELKVYNINLVNSWAVKKSTDFLLSLHSLIQPSLFSPSFRFVLYCVCYIFIFVFFYFYFAKKEIRRRKLKIIENRMISSEFLIFIYSFLRLSPLYFKRKRERWNCELRICVVIRSELRLINGKSWFCHWIWFFLFYNKKETKNS